MITKCSIPAAADLATWSSFEWTDGLQITTLPDLEMLAVRTRNSTYEITVLSGQTGDILVRGGQFFPEHTRARLAGCSLGGSFLKRHGLYVGFQMELHDEGRTIVTTKIQSIERRSNDRVQ